MNGLNRVNDRNGPIFLVARDLGCEKEVSMRDAIRHAHVISVFEWGVKTAMPNIDRESITKKCNAKESREIKVTPCPDVYRMETDFDAKVEAKFNKTIDSIAAQAGAAEK